MSNRRHRDYSVDPEAPRCSFCEKEQGRVETLISSSGVAICDECIELCNEIIEEERIKGRA